MNVGDKVYIVTQGWEGTTVFKGRMITSTDEWITVDLHGDEFYTFHRSAVFFTEREADKQLFKLKLQGENKPRHTTGIKL